MGDKIKKVYIAPQDATKCAKTNVKNFNYRADSTQITGAILDNFKYKDIDINLDGKNDITHGECVNTFYTNPVIKIQKYKCALNDSLMDNNKINSALDKLILESKTDKKVDFVNLSFGEYQKPSKTGEEFGLKSVEKSFLKLTKDTARLGIIAKINTLTNNGVNVYIASGNYKDYYNIYSLSEGITIGSNTKDGDKSRWASDNDLVKVYAQGEYIIKTESFGKTFDNVDINEDDKPDFLVQKTKKKDFKLYGTSFSTPRYVNDLYKNTIWFNKEQRDFHSNYFKGHIAK